MDGHPGGVPRGARPTGPGLQADSPSSHHGQGGAQLRRQSRAQESSRDDGDAVATAIGMATGRDDRAVGETITEPPPEPVQLLDVRVGDGGCELDLEGDDATVVAFYDEVDLMASIAWA